MNLKSQFAKKMFFGERRFEAFYKWINSRNRTLMDEICIRNRFEYAKHAEDSKVEKSFKSSRYLMFNRSVM